MSFLSLQHITLSTHSSLSGYPTWVLNSSEWSVSLPCLHGSGTQSKKVYRGGWGSLLTPSVAKKSKAACFGRWTSWWRQGGEQGPNDCSAESSWIPAPSWGSSILYFSHLKLPFRLWEKLQTIRWVYRLVHSKAEPFLRAASARGRFVLV